MITETKELVVQHADAKRVKDYREFVMFVVENLRVFHRDVRKGEVRDPILVVIESQNSNCSDLVYDYVRMLVDKGERALENIHFIRDWVILKYLFTY